VGTPAAANGDVPLPERQTWILDRLRKGEKVDRQMVEKQFSIGDKQAKRLLAELTASGKAVFVRTPRPGHYRFTAS
jgi:hypothetical protein